MPDTFDQRIARKARRQLAIKYFLPGGIAILMLLMCGQLAVQFVPLDRLNQTSGKITSLETKVISWTHHRGSSRNTPNYGLVITLDNGYIYHIQEKPYWITLANQLKVNDHIVLYYPTRAVKMLSAGLIHDIDQIERDNQILYSWVGVKQRSRFLIYMYLGFTICLYMLRRGFIWIDE